MSGQVTITQLPNAAALTGSESVPVVQNGVTVQTTTGAISGAGALNYPFLTVGSTAGLTQARYLSTTTGLSLTDNGAGSTLTINMTGTASSLNGVGTGIIVKDSASTVTNRQLTVGAGMTISNGTGVSGDPVIGVNTNLQNLSSLTGTGLMTINGSTFSQTSIQGTTSQISIANGTGVGGAPTVSLASNPILPGTGGVQVPSGTSAQRLGVNGVIRYNTDNANFEFYQNSAWQNIGTGNGSVTNVQGTVNQITVVNGTTVPVISITSNPIIPGTASLTLPIGGSLARPATPVGGMLRYNSDLGVVEAYTPSGWITLGTGGGSGGVTAIATGTGLVGGPITTTGTIAIADTTVVAGTYGSSSNIPQIIINAQGQITSATNIAVSTGGTVTSVNVSGGTTGLTTSGGPITSSGTITLAGTLAATNGGTAQSTYSAGDILYASATNTLSKLSVSTNGYVLTLAGGLPTWAASTGGVTSFNTSLSGLTPSIASTGAITLAGTLGISSGGTGQATAAAAFNALSPITTTGDLIIGNGTNSATRLGIGSNGYVLTSNGTTAAWQAASGGSSSQANAYAWFIS